ncbi:MAG: Holliday junction branch migration protein RuvA [Proteobacteria bacterium]|nr:Holliday junction branch migration protein RuvA [Pseudomonadota bacterium]
MIGFLRGVVIDLGADEVIIEASGGGVGYRVLVTGRELGGLGLGQEVSLHISTQVREDAILLYGFRTRDERTLFTKLILVNGVGAKLALSIMNALAPGELQRAVLSKNTGVLRQISGVGPKVAQRLVLELESLLSGCAFSDFSPLPAQKIGQSSHADTRSALANLGFSESSIEAAMQALDALEESMSVEEEIRWALSQMKTR